jgi:hypothetical protein
MGVSGQLHASAGPTAGIGAVVERKLSFSLRNEVILVLEDKTNTSRCYGNFMRRGHLASGTYGAIS